MHRILRKDQILTLPNLLSLVRLLLIPVIVWLYVGKGNRIGTVIVIALSGLTDVADGIIARRCHMESDFGKILDPIADKLTQLVVLLCLVGERPELWLLVAFFVVKELVMGLLGLFTIRKKDVVGGAKWHGKLNTVLLYATMALRIIAPKMPLWLWCGLVTLCSGMMFVSLAGYVMFYIRLFRAERKSAD